MTGPALVRAALAASGLTQAGLEPLRGRARLRRAGVRLRVPRRGRVADAAGCGDARQAYDDALDSAAEQAFDHTVRPFCEHRGWRFLAGNGTYWIGPGVRGGGDNEAFCRDRAEAADDTEALAVFDLLDIDADGYALGSLMPDYEPSR